MICNKCGAEVNDSAKFCGSCGTAVVSKPSTPVHEEEQPKKFWQKTWFAIVMLFVLPPVGIALMWYNNLFGKWVRIGLSIVIGLAFISGMKDSKPTDSTGKNVVASSSSKSNKKIAQSEYSERISRVTGLSPEEANNVEKIFASIGITEPKLKVSKDYEGMGTTNKEYPKSKAFTIATKEESNDDMFWALINENKLIYVNYHGHVLFEEGKVLDNYQNYILSFDTKYKLYEFIQNVIKEASVNPRSVEFPSMSDWKFRRDKNNHNIIVSSYVESKNEYNALVRNKFRFVFKPDAKDWIEFTLDGQTYRK